MRKNYLQEYHPALFEIMVMIGALFHHLIETEEAADQMKWAGIMNSCKAQAEEIIFHEIIYA